MTVTETSPKLLHTLLRHDVYDRLLAFAKQMSTGRGHWDFGVVIEYLLNNLEYSQRISELEARLDLIENEKLEKQVTQQKPHNPYGLIGKRFKERDGGEKNG